MVTRFSSLTDEELEDRLEHRLDQIREMTGEKATQSDEFQLYQEILNRMPNWIGYGY